MANRQTLTKLMSDLIDMLDDYDFEILDDGGKLRMELESDRGIHIVVWAREAGAFMEMDLTATVPKDQYVEDGDNSALEARCREAVEGLLADKWADLRFTLAETGNWSRRHSSVPGAYDLMGYEIKMSHKVIMPDEILLVAMRAEEEPLKIALD